MILQQIERNLWVAEQPLKFMGLEVGTRMSVIRLANNSLLLISPIKIESQIKSQLDKLGTVKYLIAPNLFHYLYLAEAQLIYPQAQILSPPGLANKQPKLKIDKVLTEAEINFNSEVDYALLAGFQVFIAPKIRPINEIIFYHSSSKSLIITDSAFNFDDSFPFVTQLAVRVLGSYQELKPSWLEKIAIQDKQKLKSSIAQILAWDFQRVIMCHGTIVETNAKEQLYKGYQWLL